MPRKAKRMKIIEMPDYRVCTECHQGPLLDMGHYLFCPAEDPHPGGVLLYGAGRVVRADRRLTARQKA